MVWEGKVRNVQILGKTGVLYADVEAYPFAIWGGVERSLGRRKKEVKPMQNETPFFTDLSHFVAATHQDCEMIAELLRRKRYEEAEEAITARSVNAQMVLKRLETETLPAVDLDLTEDATPAGRRYYVK